MSDSDLLLLDIRCKGRQKQPARRLSCSHATDEVDRLQAISQCGLHLNYSVVDVSVRLGRDDGLEFQWSPEIGEVLPKVSGRWSSQHFVLHSVLKVLAQ